MTEGTTGDATRDAGGEATGSATEGTTGSATGDAISRLRQALGLSVLEKLAGSGTPVAIEGKRIPLPGGTQAIPLTFAPYPGFDLPAVLFLPSGGGRHPAVLVAEGHFGGGKSDGESQGPARALAARGMVALVVDTPGVEEGDVSGRSIHFARGLPGVAMLTAAGIPPMGVEVENLRRALDYLQHRPEVDPQRIAITGASGGATQAYYALLTDRRLRGAALVAYELPPREARAVGCLCDVVPGWAGPSPELLAASGERPVLYVADHEGPPPEGLPSGALARAAPGRHSYEDVKRAVTLPWLDTLLGHRPTPGAPLAEEHLPPEALRSPFQAGSTGPGLHSLVDLAMAAPPRPSWRPTASGLAVPHQVDCQGRGATVMLVAPPAWLQGENEESPTAGPPRGDPDRKALLEAGFRVCTVTFPGSVRPVFLGEALVNGPPLAERFAGAVRAARTELERQGTKAVASWGVGAGVLAAKGADPDGILVARAFPMKLSAIDPRLEPPWIFVPGLWPGGLKALLSGALVGEDPAALAEALKARLAQGP